MDARKLLTSLFANLLLTLHAEEPGKFLIKVEPGAFTIERALQEARDIKMRQQAGHAILELQPGT